jgi:acetylglutamate synthase
MAHPLTGHDDMLNKKLISTVCLAALASPALAANPIVKNIFTADPAVVVSDGRLYMYTGRDEAPTA